MRRRRWPWLLAAVVLIGLAAWLMAREDPERTDRKHVKLPRRMTAQESERASQRRTLLTPVASDGGTGNDNPGPTRPRDPILAALPSKVEKGAVVVEANAIRHSPVGELLIDCMTSRDDGRGLQELREATGVDPLEDVDRVAMADETMMITGHFDKAKWKDILKSDGTAWGQSGTIYAPPTRRDGGTSNFRVATWKDEMVVVGQSEAEVQAVLDRLEGRGLGGDPVISESQTYGEIYGVLSAQALAEMLPKDQAGLAEKLRNAADKVELHVDTTRDVGIVANVTGPNAGDARDLGKTLGAALSLGRLQAQAEGKTELAELMDLARVVPTDSAFNVEMGLPLEVLEKYLKQCVEVNRARNAARAAGDGGI